MITGKSDQRIEDDKSDICDNSDQNFLLEKWKMFL